MVGDEWVMGNALAGSTICAALSGLRDTLLQVRDDGPLARKMGATWLRRFAATVERWGGRWPGRGGAATGVWRLDPSELAWVSFTAWMTISRRAARPALWMVPR